MGSLMWSMGSALGGVIVTAVVLSPQSPANESVCASMSHGVADWICVPSSLEITDAEAAEFIDGFDTRLQGSRRETGSFRYLNPNDNLRKPPEDYVDQWRKVVYAVRTAPVTRDAKVQNVFTTTLQILYYVDDVEAENPPAGVERVGVDDLDVTFDLAYDAKGRVTSAVPRIDDRRPHPSFQSLVRVTAVEDTDFSDRPEPSGDGQSSFLKGAHMMALCQQEDADGAAWVLTHLGWVPATDLTTASAVVPAPCPTPTS